MKEISKTTKTTVLLNLVGILMLVLACVFVGLAFGTSMSAVRSGYLTDQVLINTLVFFVSALVCLIIAIILFLGEIYKSLSNLEKEVYGKRENR